MTEQHDDHDPYFTPAARAEIAERVDAAVMVVTVAANGRMDLTRIDGVEWWQVQTWLRALSDSVEEWAGLDNVSTTPPDDTPPAVEESPAERV